MMDGNDDANPVVLMKEGERQQQQQQRSAAAVLFVAGWNAESVPFAAAYSHVVCRSVRSLPICSAIPLQV